MPSIEAIERTTDLSSLENENNIYEAVDILIAEGGGGGGGLKPSEKKEKDLKKALKSYEFFEKKRKEAIAKGESTTEIDKKIKKWEKKIIQLDRDYFPQIELEIMGGGPNSRPKEPETQDNNGELDIPIGEGGSDAGTNREDNRTREYKEAIEYNKKVDKTNDAKFVRKFYNKVINLKKKINTSQPPKEGDFFEFLDNKYARLKQLDLIESYLVLVMSEYKKLSEFSDSRFQSKYNPNIDALEEQVEVLRGMYLSDEYRNSFKYDFDMLRYYYSNNLISGIKTITSKGESDRDDMSYEELKKLRKERGF